MQFCGISFALLKRLDCRRSRGLRSRVALQKSRSSHCYIFVHSMSYKELQLLMVSIELNIY